MDVGAVCMYERMVYGDGFFMIRANVLNLSSCRDKSCTMARDSGFALQSY